MASPRRGLGLRQLRPGQGVAGRTLGVDHIGLRRSPPRGADRAVELHDQLTEPIEVADRPAP